MRNVTLEGRIVILKIVFQSPIYIIPNHYNLRTNKYSKKNWVLIQKNLSTYSKRHETLCKENKDGGLKNVEISKKTISLQCSWVRRLYDESLYKWKIIPLRLIKMLLAISLDLILIWHLKDIMLNCFYITTEVFSLNGTVIFFKNER